MQFLILGHTEHPLGVIISSVLSLGFSSLRFLAAATVVLNCITGRKMDSRLLDCTNGNRERKEEKVAVNLSGSGL